jgi:hypothetical protein
MAKGKGFPDFFKKKGKKGAGPSASDQADALRMDSKMDKKSMAAGKGDSPKGFVPFKKKGK